MGVFEQFIDGCMGTLVQYLQIMELLAHKQRKWKCFVRK
jgi:hypothetical protein